MLNPLLKHDYNSLPREELILLLEQKDQIIDEVLAEVEKLGHTLNIREKAIFGRSSEKMSIIAPQGAVDLAAANQQEQDGNTNTVENQNEASAEASQPQSEPISDEAEDMGDSEPDSLPKPKRKYNKPHPGRSLLGDFLETNIVKINIDDYNPETDQLLASSVSRKFSIRLIFSVEETHRQTIRRNGEVIRAPFPANDPFYKHKMTLDSVALLLTMRFVLHTPYYRFHQILPENLIGYNTIVENAGKAYDLLAPLDPVLLTEVTTGTNCLMIDESEFDELESEENIEKAIAEAKAAAPQKKEASNENQKKKKTKKQVQKNEEITKEPKSTQQKVKHTGRIWTLTNEAKKLVYFRYSPTRGKYNAEVLLQGYKGLLMSDAYAAYISIAEDVNNAIILMLCWSHARRKFTDLIKKGQKTDPVILEILRRIGLLFKIEKQIKGKSAEEILTARQESFKILTDLKIFLEEKRNLYTPKEAIVESMDYILNHWQYFIEYTKHADGCLHNNAAEASLRSVVISRKNSLFFGSNHAGQGSALMFALVHNCKLHKIDFLTWVTDVMKRISTHPKDKLDELLPHKWTPLRSE